MIAPLVNVYVRSPSTASDTRAKFDRMPGPPIITPARSVEDGVCSTIDIALVGVYVVVFLAFQN